MEGPEFANAVMDFAEAWPPMARPTTRASFVGYIRTGHLGGWGLVFSRPVILEWAEAHHQLLAVELLRRRQRDAVLKLYAEETRVIHMIDSVTRELKPKDPPWFWVDRKLLRVKLWNVVGDHKRHATLHGPSPPA